MKTINQLQGQDNGGVDMRDVIELPASANARHVDGARAYRDVLVDLVTHMNPTTWADDELESYGLIRLPVGADGVPIRIGDTVFGKDGKAWEVTHLVFGKPHCVRGQGSGGRKDTKDMRPEWLTHEPPTVEGALAMMVCDIFGNSRSVAEADLRTGIINGYAKRLQLVGA